MNYDSAQGYHHQVYSQVPYLCSDSDCCFNICLVNLNSANPTILLVLNQPHHKAHLSHEILGGAAAFEAMRMWEKHQEATGHHPGHQMAKEISKYIRLISSRYVYISTSSECY